MITEPAAKCWSCDKRLPTYYEDGQLVIVRHRCRDPYPEVSVIGEIPGGVVRLVDPPRRSLLERLRHARR